MSSALRDRPDTLADSQLGVLNNINISGSVLDRAETGRPTRVFFYSKWKSWSEVPTTAQYAKCGQQRLMWKESHLFWKVYLLLDSTSYLIKVKINQWTYSEIYTKHSLKSDTILQHIPGTNWEKTWPVLVVKENILFM